MDDHRKSPLIAFRDISDQYATLIFFFTMFGCPKITFNHISLSNQCKYLYFCFTKWPQENKSPLIAFLGILCRWPFWMSDNHIRSDISPFQINTQYFCLMFSQNGLYRPFWFPNKFPFRMTEDNFLPHFSPFQINTQLFLNYYFKMAGIC